MRQISIAIVSKIPASMSQNCCDDAAHIKADVAHRDFAALLARLAVRCLYTELSLYPKPGLVSLVDNGSHEDMTASTFMHSLFSSRGYYKEISLAGMTGASFNSLKKLGIVAEKKMMLATGGINTHRGAIFSLGLLCAAIGHAKVQRQSLSPTSIRHTLLTCWGDELRTHMQVPSGKLGSPSNGVKVGVLHGASGAREEAALGLPSVFEIGVPALQATLAAGRSMYHAKIDALFALMAYISDTNVYHRGGAEGAAIVKHQAQHFMSLGGTAHPDWYAHALACHRLFIAKKLSPGGAADLLAASCLVHAISSDAITANTMSANDNENKLGPMQNCRCKAQRQRNYLSTASRCNAAETVLGKS